MLLSAAAMVRVRLHANGASTKAIRAFLQHVGRASEVVARSLLVTASMLIQLGALGLRAMQVHVALFWRIAFRAHERSALAFFRTTSTNISIGAPARSASQVPCVGPADKTCWTSVTIALILPGTTNNVCVVVASKSPALYLRSIVSVSIAGRAFETAASAL